MLYYVPPDLLPQFPAAIKGDISSTNKYPLMGSDNLKQYFLGVKRQTKWFYII